MLSFTCLLAPERFNAPAYQSQSVRLVAQPQLTQMQSAMSEIGLPPLKRERVERYKQKIFDRLKFLSRAQLVAVLSILPFVVNVIWGIAFLVTLVVKSESMGILGVPFAVNGTLFVGALAVVFYCQIKEVPEDFRGTQWLIRPVEIYFTPIPKEVRDNQALLALKYPQAKFYVEYLREDPFMLAEDECGRREYFQAWDAPGFNQERVS